MGSELHPRAFGHAHIRRVGPLILGDTAWANVASLPMESWDQFVALVEQRYGLTHEQCVSTMFAVRRAPAETYSQFVLRLEGLRARYGIRGSEMFRHFREKLERGERDRLDAMVDQAAFQDGPSAGQQVGWANLVNLATHRAANFCFSPSN